MCWCCYSEGWGRVSIAITVSCHSWTVGVRSCPETWPSRSWTKNMFPFWASLNVCFAIFKLPWLWPFRDGLSWQQGIDSQGKSLQKEKTPHRCLFTAGFPCCCPSKAVLKKTIWNVQGINSLFPGDQSRLAAQVTYISHDGFLRHNSKKLLEMFDNWHIFIVLLLLLLRFPSAMCVQMHALCLSTSSWSCRRAGCCWLEVISTNSRLLRE